jgi:hypothetical protein
MNGLTVKELKDFVRDLPEINPDTNEDLLVFIGLDGYSNSANMIAHCDSKVSEDNIIYSDVIISQEG